LNANKERFDSIPLTNVSEAVVGDRERMLGVVGRVDSCIGFDRVVDTIGLLREREAFARFGELKVCLEISFPL